ncbi:hypothetical protein MTO96_016651 [Rhipicephalus appendiculatus]
MNAMGGAELFVSRVAEHAIEPVRLQPSASRSSAWTACKWAPKVCQPVIVRTPRSKSLGQDRAAIATSQLTGAKGRCSAVFAVFLRKPRATRIRCWGAAAVFVLVYLGYYHQEAVHFHLNHMYAHVGHAHAQHVVAHKYLHETGASRRRAKPPPAAGG